MRTKLLLLFCLFIMCLNVSLAQSGWYVANTYPNNYGHGIDFINPNTGLISPGGGIGQGSIKKTTNGGFNWTTIRTNTPGGLSIKLFNENTGYVLLDQALSVTTNGGNIWIDYGIPINTANDMCFLDVNRGWVVGGGEIAKTTNGGLNWTYTLIPGVFTTIKFVSDSIGYATGYNGSGSGSQGFVYKTTNAGNNWSQSFNGTNLYLYSISFINQLTGWAAGTIYTSAQGKVLKTTNGGETWSPINIYAGEDILWSIYFKDINTGWAGSGSGKIFYTTNSGVDWELQYSYSNMAIQRLIFPDPNIGYATSNYNVFKTISGGVLIQPPSPNLIAPLNNSYNQILTPLMDWDSIPISNSYRIQISTNSGFTSTVLDSSGLFSSFLQLPSGKLSNNTMYYWRVNGTNTAGTGTWSSIWNFTTILAIPNLISPTNNTTGITLSPLLDWSDVTGASSYQVQVSTNSGFTTTVIDISSLASSQYQIPSGILQANTQYYWRANASNSNGTSNWSTVWNFTTIASPNTPTLISPTNNSNILTLTPTMDWSDVTTATSYILQIATDTNFINLIVNQSGLTASQYLIPSSTLTGNTTYYWRAKAVNEAGSGQWSFRWNFRVVTTPPSPNLISPLNNSTNQPPTVFLDWDSLTSATTYRIQLAIDSLFNSITYDTIGVTRSYLLMRSGILLANVKYFWRVNATNLAGTGLWSIVWNFRINPTGVSQYSLEIPKEFKLFNNYPNPFNPSTNIKFDIPKNTGVKVSIYDISGRLISQPIHEFLNAGRYELSWNAANIASGVYFYRIETESFTNVKRMLLVK